MPPLPGPQGAAAGRDAEAPSHIPAAGWKDIARRIRSEISDDRLVLSAAGIAFYAFLALIPALAVLVSVAGLVLDPDKVTERTQDLFANLPEEARALLVDQLETVAGRAGGALSLSVVVGVLLSLWSASGGMGHLIEGVNVAYDEHDHRGFVAKRALALAFTLGAIVFVVFALLGLAALAPILDALGLRGWLDAIVQSAFWLVLVAGFAVGLGLLYRYAPDREEPRWRWVTWGSAVAVTLWVVASLGFRIYAANFGSYDKSYGSLAAVAVLLTWLFITAFVVLLGAEINAEIEHQTARDTTTGPDRPLGQRGAVMADTVGAGSDQVPSPPSANHQEVVDERSIHRPPGNPGFRAAAGGTAVGPGRRAD